MKKTKSFHKKPEKLLGTEQEGLLVASYGASAEVEDVNGAIIRCHLRKNMEPVITGDRVLWRLEQDGSGVVVDHLPRKSFLARPENKNKSKPVAANVDAMLVVTAPRMFAEHLIDRYIVAAENLNLLSLIVLNKIDLLNDELQKKLDAQLEVYKNIGYRVIYSSTVSKSGLDELDAFLQGRNSILVGASGVGKSSIIASFVDKAFVRIGETSTQGLGKHTTTMTRLYHLPHGGDLIDSPGVREFGLWHMNADEILQGFVEFKPFLGQCKFRDCRHHKEPGCALRQAVVDKKISGKRFESFQEMILENL